MAAEGRTLFPTVSQREHSYGGFGGGTHASTCMVTVRNRASPIRALELGNLCDRHDGLSVRGNGILGPFAGRADDLFPCSARRRGSNFASRAGVPSKQLVVSDVGASDHEDLIEAFFDHADAVITVRRAHRRGMNVCRSGGRPPRRP
jgi:hypothetical protein